MSSKEQRQDDHKAKVKRQPLKSDVHDRETLPPQNHLNNMTQQAGLDPASLTLRNVLQLQRSIGNQAVDQLIAQMTQRQQPPVTEPTFASGYNRTIQRARLNIRPNGTISGVSDFPDRPTSNVSGSQGQHLTAYVVFEDMIKSRVKDRTVKNAATELVKVLKEILELPGMQGNVANYLRKASREKIKILEGDINAKGVGEIIDEILSIRNKVPGTAVTGFGGGHGEAKHSGILETLETALRRNEWPGFWKPDTVSNQARYAVWRLFDFNPPNPKNDDQIKFIATKIITHYKSIISAYPMTDQWLNSRKEYYEDYLRRNIRSEKEMPLLRIQPKELNNIFLLVSSYFRKK